MSTVGNGFSKSGSSPGTARKSTPRTTPATAPATSSTEYCETKKRSFRDARAAHDQLDFLRTRHGVVNQTTYSCELCGNWHLTSMEQRPPEPAPKFTLAERVRFK